MEVVLKELAYFVGVACFLVGFSLGGGGGTWGRRRRAGLPGGPPPTTAPGPPPPTTAPSPPPTALAPPTTAPTTTAPAPTTTARAPPPMTAKRALFFGRLTNDQLTGLIKDQGLDLGSSKCTKEALIMILRQLDPRPDDVKRYLGWDFE